MAHLILLDCRADILRLRNPQPGMNSCANIDPTCSPVQHGLALIEALNICRIALYVFMDERPIYQGCFEHSNIRDPNKSAAATIRDWTFSGAFGVATGMFLGNSNAGAHDYAHVAANAPDRIWVWVERTG